MDFILTLVAADNPLTPAHIAKIEHWRDGERLGVAGAQRWIEPHKAADIPLSQKLTQEQIRALRENLASDRIDFFVIPAANRVKKLLVADMDSTIITMETLDEIAAFIGIGEETADITRRAMNGELDFESSLRERVAKLAGLSVDVLQTVLDQSFLSPGAEALVRGMAAQGATCILASGGFTFYTEAIARRAGFHHHHGNVLHIENGLLTGTVASPVLDKNAKKDILRKWCEKLGIGAADALTIGDGANDIPMLVEAGLGIGYHPRPAVKDTIDNCILYGDLSAALYAMGLRP